MKFLTTILFLFVGVNLFAQSDSIGLLYDQKIEEKKFKTNSFDANSPAKAAFYSAVLPGLGQFYNKSYWKIPLVYAALGTTLFFYIDNNNQYNRYRDAYKSRLAGFENDEFINILSENDLINAQRVFRQNRDLSLLLTIAAYILNIVDANVEAHLNRFEISEDLSIRPSSIQNWNTGQNTLGLSLKLKL